MGSHSEEQDAGEGMRDLVAIFHASFHPTKGNVIDWSVKAQPDVDLTNVEFSCLPSGLHLVETDVIYFSKDGYQGACVFRRRQTTEHGHRGFRLSSFGILLAESPRPRPWRHVPALKALVEHFYSSLEDRTVLDPTEEDWEPARRFFEERRVREPATGNAGVWEGWSRELEGSPYEASPTVHLPHLLRILGPSCLTLYKHILGRRRVLIVTLPPVEAACILCQVAADMCFEEQIADLISPSESEDTRALRGKSKGGVKVLGMVNLNDVDRLDYESKTGRGWIACTTDSIFLDKPSHYDLLIDLRSSTPNTRPAFFVSKPIDSPSRRGPTHRLSSVRFTWSDVRLWSELDRLLHNDSEDDLDLCCHPSHQSGASATSTTSTWTDVWRMYEDVCVLCAGIWMGAWRTTTSGTNAKSTSSEPSTSTQSEAWGSIRLEGDDALRLQTHSNPTVRALGQGIEGGPSGSTISSGSRTLRALRRSSNMSVFTWSGGKTDPDADDAPSSTETAAPDGIFIPGARSKVPQRERSADSARRERQVITTLALLEAFSKNTASVLGRLATLLATRPQREADTSGAVVLSPKDVMSFELGPFSGLDARFVEWLGEEYGAGVRVVVRRGWRDLVGLILGLG